jgi:hypothetical protein
LPGALHTALFIALQLLSRELFASDHPNFIILRPRNLNAPAHSTQRRHTHGDKIN